MANTFFGFDTSINNGDHLLPPDDDDDCLENEEEEYDALNDETFGPLEDSSILDDWEQQHEQFAEIAESSKHSDHIEDSISRLIVDDYASPPPSPIPLTSRNNVWAYTPSPSLSTKQNGDMFHNSPSLILNSLQKASKSFIETHAAPIHHQFMGAPPPPHLHHHSNQPKIIRTVEELEKNLIKPPMKLPPPRLIPPSHVPPQQFQFMQRLPPGLPPMGMRPPPHMPMNHPQPPPHLPPGLVPLPPHLAPPHFMNGAPPPPNRMMQPPHPKMFFLPPQQMQHQQQQMRNQQQMQQRVMQPPQQQQQQKHRETNRDEYAGLMTSREKQWLLNIQMLQLNTGTPYFDDYYFTVFKERRAKREADINLMPPQHRGFANSMRNNRNNNNQNNNNGNNGGGSNNGQDNNLTPRVYTPLQFENSLGKLQCGSVTAPRKIIDMDIVQPEKESEQSGQSQQQTSGRDTRKTKQLLLELESLFTLLLKAEDLRNPMAIANLEKLREIKQKQKLRELELAQTPEAKQEILKQLRQDSEQSIIVENQHDYIGKILAGLMQDDKFVSFLLIRKGKMLLLRLLPHLLSMDKLMLNNFRTTLLDLWIKVLLSIPIVGRRDMSGDQILPKLHPYFKRFVQMCEIQDVLELVGGLIEVQQPQPSESTNSSRMMTPLSHQGKAPLYFILLNRFGVSALIMLLIRTEYLISSGVTNEMQQKKWLQFLLQWSELSLIVGNSGKIAQAIESIPIQIFNKHLNRFGGQTELSVEKRRVLEKYFVDLNC